MSAHYLYRCYDADGDLIYIGCAEDVEKRIRSHRKGVARASRLLRLFMVRYEASGPYPTKEAALYAEREAIRLEQPLFNTQERGINMPASRNEVARYLIERGHRDLATELSCTCWRETRETGHRDPWCVAHRGTDLPESKEFAA
jgi:predicted GIY-YIG superfamily endonuclease